MTIKTYVCLMVNREFHVREALMNEEYIWNGWKILSAWYNLPVKFCGPSPGNLLGRVYRCALERNFK